MPSTHLSFLYLYAHFFSVWLPPYLLSLSLYIYTYMYICVLINLSVSHSLSPCLCLCVSLPMSLFLSLSFSLSLSLSLYLSLPLTSSFSASCSSLPPSWLRKDGYRRLIMSAVGRYGSKVRSLLYFFPYFMFFFFV